MTQQWERSTIHSAVTVYRAWLRFLFITGRSQHDLAQSFTVPPRVVDAEPRRALPWPTIRQLRRGIDKAAPLGRRDDAQYHLLCAYGLGAAEILHLRLTDIDWETGTLHIRRQKTGTPFDLPLLPDVARSIAQYIRYSRPRSSRRFNHRIPFGPLSSSTLAARVRVWAQRAHVNVPFLGCHSFRHSVATRQLERGTPLKVIGDILGHRHSETTEIYVRSALERLRKLALPVPV